MSKLPPHTPLPRQEYLAHLRKLLVALVQVHGELTVLAIHELANQAIAEHGIVGADGYVRQKAGMRP